MKTAGLGGGVVAVLLGATSLAAQAVDRAKPPALPPPPALKLPAVQTAALANGLELAVVEMHKVPVVDVQLVLDAGELEPVRECRGLHRGQLQRRWRRQRRRLGAIDRLRRQTRRAEQHRHHATPQPGRLHGVTPCFTASSGLPCGTTLKTTRCASTR